MLPDIEFSLAGLTFQLTHAARSVKHVFVFCRLIVLVAPDNGLIFGHLRGYDMPWQVLLVLGPGPIYLGSGPVYFVSGEAKAVLS